MTNLDHQIHEPFIRRCYQLAEQAVEKGNHPFGSLLVHKGEVILTAENSVHTASDVTRHAELNLVSLACQQFSDEILKESTLYTSTEPCAMCAGAIYWSGISAIVYGVSALSFAQIVGNDFLNPCTEILKTGQRDIMVLGPILQADGLKIHQNFW